MLDLTQAVPGYPAHPGLLARLAEAAGSSATAAYGAIEGDLALREAMATEISHFYEAPVAPDQVAITSGCNLAFAMAVSVLAGSRDEVILPTPWYFNHRMTLELLGIPAVPLPLRAEDGFLPDPDRLASALTPRSRALVLVSPNNPTGAVIPSDLLARIAILCRERGVWLVLDETYRDFLPQDGTSPHQLFSEPSWEDHVVHLYSFSKSYCLPGHRVGAILGGGAFRQALLKLLDSWQICASRPAQAALAWAIPALREWRHGNRRLMQERAVGFERAMRAAPAWKIDSLGTYFAYLRLPEDLPDALSVAEDLASRHGLLTLPGPFFGPGQQRHLRLAFANAAEPALSALPQRLTALHEAASA